MSNTMCNNILFNALKIGAMHDSMVRLYKIASDTKGIKGQSALARELNESPQAVKNWEERGISKRGAMRAQEKFGCDANWLTGSAKVAKVKNASELLASEPIRPWEWPFDIKKITPEQYASLESTQRELVEALIISYLRAREDPKQQAPENYHLSAKTT